jgi:O-antigen/teichoic acid export membrane protein
VQCGKVGQYFLYFSTVISSTLLPFVVSQKLATSYGDWIKMMRPYFFLILSGAVFLAIFGIVIYTSIFGSSFSGMQELMLILLPGYVCLGMLTLTNAIYIGNGNISRIFKGDVFGFLFVLVLDMIFVKSCGAKAAALISSLGYILVFLYLWRDVKSQFGVIRR